MPVSPSFLHRLVSVLALLGLATVSLCAAPVGSANKTSRSLHELFAAEWEYTMEQNPAWASQLGDRRWNDRWGDTSPAALQKRHEHNLQVLERLKKIDRRKLPPADQLNYDLFQKDSLTGVEE